MTKQWYITITTVILGGLLSVVPSTAVEREEKTINVGDTPTVTLINYSGLISVQGWQKNFVKLIGVRHSDNVEIDIEASPNRVRITSYVLDKLDSINKMRVDYRLFVPKKSHLEVRSNIGDVAIRNISGQVSVDVVEAAVRVAEVEGYIHAYSLGSKVVQVLRSKGTIQATTVSADILLEQIESDNVKANSTLGNITYKGNFMGGGSYSLISTDGQISVHCLEEASVEWDARTVKGSIKTDLPIKSKKHRPLRHGRQSLLGTLNDGAATVYLSTFSGPIQINRRVP